MSLEAKMKVGKPFVHAVTGIRSLCDMWAYDKEYTDKPGNYWTPPLTIAVDCPKCVAILKSLLTDRSEARERDDDSRL